MDILLVEHNPDDVELTLQAFRAARLKNRIHTVHDGPAAMDFLFRQGTYAKPWTPHLSLVVLLDLNLPNLSHQIPLARSDDGRRDELAADVRLGEVLFVHAARRQYYSVETAQSFAIQPAHGKQEDCDDSA